MKARRRLLALVMIFLLILVLHTNIFAMSSGFSTENMSLEDQKQFLSNIQISTISEAPANDSIACFDVNEAGLIALGFENFEKKS